MHRTPVTFRGFGRLLGLVGACLVLSGPALSASAPAASAPYPPSPVLAGVTFDMATLKELAPGSDNWAITWADDDHQYVSWGDGGGFGGTDRDGRASLGFGRVEGPKDRYTGHNLWGGKNTVTPAPFKGKCYGILSLGGTLFMWRTGNASDNPCFFLQELHRSTDHAVTWQYAGVRFVPEDFPNSPGFFAPTFLQFGKDYQGARDDFVYVYAPEVKDTAVWNVQKPGEITLMRVPRAKIDQRSAYEFFAGLDPRGAPTWTRAVAGRKPVFEDRPNGVMRTSISYNPGLKRYLLITQQVSRLQAENGHIGIYDAPEPWGPWTTVLFANAWSVGLQNGYKTVYWNFSNKWLSADGKRFVLVYTGAGADNWGTVEGTFRTRDGGASAP